MNAAPQASTSAGSALPGRLALFAAVAAAALWVWICWCLFAGRGWNDIRLAPVFGLKLGLPLYAGNAGPVGTWMYGPLPVLLLWPATWAADAGHALLVADTINLGLQLGAIIAVCALWPLPAGMSARGGVRVMAAALAVIVFPASMWEFLQADNAAVAFGLLANLVLVRSASPGTRWSAAVLATAGLMCKQTSVAVPVAQLIWLACTEDRRAAWRHAARLAACGAVWLGLLLLWQDPAAMFFNLITTPGRLPWSDAPWDRLRGMAYFLAVYAVTPAAVWVWLRRDRLRSALALPTLAWLCGWIPGLAGFLKIGGTINNLQSFPLWLPAAAVVTVAAAGKKFGHGRMQAAIAAVVVVLSLWRIDLESAPPLRPSLQLYREGEVLAKMYPNQIWFPWQPLLTVYSEQRLYHVEDGLYVRYLMGQPPGPELLMKHLPPGMRAIALLRNARDTGVALALMPPGAKRVDLGLWKVFLLAPRPAGPLPSAPP